MSSILNVGEIRADAWKNSNGTENYKCRAWVNFNGTGTPAIRASGNVSSITDNGTGDYTVNFANALPNANYAVGLGCAELAPSTIFCPKVKAVSTEGAATLKTTTQLEVIFCASSYYDSAEMYVILFG